MVKLNVRIYLLHLETMFRLDFNTQFWAKDTEISKLNFFGYIPIKLKFA